jgi:hypothetical protein
MSLTVVSVHDRVHLPGADQPAIESHLVGAIGRRAVRDQQFDQGGRGTFHGMACSVL